MKFPKGVAILDTSAIIQLREERYAHDVFPSLIRDFEQAAQDKSVITVDRVIQELGAQSSKSATASANARRLTADWAVAKLHALDYRNPGHELGEIRRLTAEISRNHQTWQNAVPADPMVIATAEILDGVVISGETQRIEDPENPTPISGDAQIRNEFGLYSSWIRIPDICLIRGIPHLDLLSFFRTQRWSF